MPGVFQLFAVVAMSFACVLHLVIASYALHHHVFKTCIRPDSSTFRLLSVLSPDTLARARGMSGILFYKWPEMFSEWDESWRVVFLWCR